MDVTPRAAPTATTTQAPGADTRAAGTSGGHLRDPLQRGVGAPGGGAPTAPSGGPDEPLRQLSGSTIQGLIKASGVAPEEIAKRAKVTGLSQAEIKALLSGSDMAMTPEREEQLRGALADAYAPSPTPEAEDAVGICCGGSSSVPSITTASSDIAVTSAGDVAHTGRSGDGAVTLRHNVTFKVGETSHGGGFSAGYTGTDSKDARGLQFTWREIVWKDGGDKVSALGGAVTTTGGTYDLTTGGTMTAEGTPGQSNVNTGSASEADPFYEAAGAVNRTADATTIFDRPAAVNAKVNERFEDGATEVKSRAHVSTFLVKSNAVTYKTTTNVEYRFTVADDTPAPVLGTGDHGAATELDPAALPARLHPQLPSLPFIR